jgi:uncharacterized protein YkwD
MQNRSRFILHLTFIVFLAGSLLFLSSFLVANPIDDEVLRYTNEFRRSNGLPALLMQNELNKIALAHSQDMASGRRGFGHGGFDKREKEIERDFKCKAVAENVAFGQNSGREVVTAWKNSNGHRHNMLGNYRLIGVGTARDREGQIYFTEIFVR